MRVKFIGEGGVQARRGGGRGRVSKNKRVGEAVGGWESRKRIDVRWERVRIIGACWMSGALWRRLSVEFDVGAAALSVNTLRCEENERKIRLIYRENTHSKD